VTGATSNGAASWAAAWRSAREQAGARWQGLAPRERIALGSAGAVVALFLLWSLAIQPAWKTLRSAPAQLDQLESQLQSMQRLAAEARDLRALPPVTAAQASLALKGATDRLGAKAQIVVQGDRATLTLNSVPPDALRGWLGEVRSAARARPVEVRLTQGPQGYSGSIVVTLAGAGS
jgi:general secretion pathway protein M